MPPEDYIGVQFSHCLAPQGEWETLLSVAKTVLGEEAAVSAAIAT